MSKQALIDYENAQKLKNIDTIAGFNQNLIELDEAIVQLNLNIDQYNNQKIITQGRIDTVKAENIKIGEIVVILTAS